MNINDYIQSEFMILIFVTYLFGEQLKKFKVKNEHIPAYVSLFSILMCLIKTLAHYQSIQCQDIFDILFTAITQGILTAGMAVYSNQLLKQHMKKKS